MKDMKLHYSDKLGTIRTEEFDTIMDFLDEYENNTKGLELNDIRNTQVWAVFFENPYNTKSIDYDPVHSMHGMYVHCQNMVK